VFSAKDLPSVPYALATAGGWPTIHHWLSHHVAFGDVPTWLAFGGAAFAAWYTFGTLRLERGRDEERQRGETKAQAQRVSAWPDLGEPVGAIKPPWAQAQVIVVNLSDQPVTRVAVAMLVHQELRLVGLFSMLPPSQDRVLSLPLELSDELARGPLKDHATPESHAFVDDWRERYQDLPVIVQFTDARGLVWIRDIDGLKPIENASDPRLIRGGASV
jgi:hypothetical protein